jgi:hypothetical protein
LVAGAALLAAAIAPGEARGDEPARYPVRVKPAGLAWTFDSSPPAAPCPPEGCVLHVPGGRYDFVAGGVRESVDVKGPTTLTVHRGVPFLHRASGYFLGGGLALGVGALAGALFVCGSPDDDRAPDVGERVTSRPCEDGPYARSRRDAQLVLYAVSGTGFGAAFLGAFAYFFTGPWVGTRAGAPRPGLRPLRPQFGFAPARGGGSGTLTLRF